MVVRFADILRCCGDLLGIDSGEVCSSNLNLELDTHHWIFDLLHGTDSVDNFMGIVAGSLVGALIYYKHTNDYKVYLYYQHLKERMKEDEEKDSKALELKRAFENK